MSDRHAGYVVTLESPLKDEVSQEIVNAIRLLKGVVSVEPVVDSPERQIASQSERCRLERKLMEVLGDK